MKHKVVDKTLEKRFLKEFKTTCHNSSQSGLKQQKAILKSFGSVMLSALQFFRRGKSLLLLLFIIIIIIIIIYYYYYYYYYYY